MYTVKNKLLKFAGATKCGCMLFFEAGKKIAKGYENAECMGGKIAKEICFHD